MSRRFVCCAIAAFSVALPTTVLAEQQACTALVATSYFASAVAEQSAAVETQAQRQLSLAFLQALAKKTQLPIKVLKAQEAKALAEVRSGRADLIIGLSEAPELEPVLDYLFPAYAQKTYGLWVRTAEHRTLKQWPELLGMRGVRLASEQQLLAFDRQAQALNWPVRAVKSLSVAIDNLVEGKADYLVAEQQGVQAYLLKYDLLRRFELMEQPVETQSFYLALAKDSACNTSVLRKTLSAGLSQLAEAAKVP